MDTWDSPKEESAQITLSLAYSRGGSTPTPENLKEKSSELLLADLKHFGELFQWNEEVGEKRLNFFITLVTAVLTAMVALITAKDNILHIEAPVAYLIAVFASFALLQYGRLTLHRMITRDSRTDEYKAAQDRVRNYFQAFDKQLRSYNPFGGTSFWVQNNPDIDRALGNLGNLKTILHKNDNIRKVFRENRIELSGSATGQKEGTSSRIVDGKADGKEYCIARYGEELKVFELKLSSRNLRRGSLLDIVVLLNSIIVSASVAFVVLFVSSLVSIIVSAFGTFVALCVSTLISAQLWPKSKPPGWWDWVTRFVMSESKPPGWWDWVAGSSTIVAAVIGFLLWRRHQYSVINKEADRKKEKCDGNG